MSHQLRITLSLERKQFHPSSHSWKKPFLVVSVPNQVSSAQLCDDDVIRLRLYHLRFQYAMQILQVQKIIQITFFSIAKQKKIEKFIKTINCSFLPSNRDSGISGTNRFLSNSSRDPEFNISLPVYWVQSKIFIKYKSKRVLWCLDESEIKMSEVQQSENNNEETLPLSPDCVQKKITSGMIEILVRVTVRREVCLSDGRFDRI